MQYFNTIISVLVSLEAVLCGTIPKLDDTKDLITSESRHYHQHHVAENGGSHHADRHLDESEFDKRGHDSAKKYSKGDFGKRGKSSQSTDYDQNHSKKENHHDSSDHYDKHDAHGKTLKSASFGEKEGHKRGHKTTGYHNKFFKDEYVREHKFYDNYRRKGNFKKHGEYLGKHDDREGGHRKGGSKKSSYNADGYGKKGHHDRGHYEDENKGYNQAQGNQKYYKSREDYGRNSDGNGRRQYHYHRRH